MESVGIRLIQGHITSAQVGSAFSREMGSPSACGSRRSGQQKGTGEDGRELQRNEGRRTGERRQGASEPAHAAAKHGIVVQEFPQTEMPGPQPGSPSMTRMPASHAETAPDRHDFEKGGQAN
jgi:hypothetical protein